MSTYLAPAFAISDDGRHIVVSYGCSCGWASERHNVSEIGDPAGAEVRAHVADAHGAEFELGRCSVCGIPTDYFRAHFAPLDGGAELADEYLCQQHAPAADIVDQGAAGDLDDAGTPFNVVQSVSLTYREGIDQ